jgi:hypothetical protein
MNPSPLDLQPTVFLSVVLNTLSILVFKNIINKPKAPKKDEKKKKEPRK